MNVLSSMLLLKSSLSESSALSQTINTILSHRDEVKDASIYDIADLCNVSPSSVTRLCNSLGYTGFKAFQQDFKETCNNFEFYNRVLSSSVNQLSEDVFTSIISTLNMQIDAIGKLDYQSLEHIADLIHDHSIIHFFSEDPSSFTMQQLEIDLIMNNKEVFTHSIQYLDNCAFPQDSIVIFFCPNYPRRNPMLPIFELVAQTPAKTIVIAHNKKEYWDKASYTLYIPYGTKTLIDNFGMGIVECILAEIYRAKYLDRN